MKKKVLFICTHNSARSQIAEGLLNYLYGSKYEAFSAGTKPSTVNPYAIKSMAEIGIDISMHRSKSIEEFSSTTFDCVVTVCDNAKETCPFFPGGGKYIHKSFNDPSSFEGEDNNKLVVFRKVRDEIKDWIKRTF
jgi:arsenate reductase (thioredoxin)